MSVSEEEPIKAVIKDGVSGMGIWPPGLLELTTRLRYFKFGITQLSSYIAIQYDEVF